MTISKNVFIVGHARCGTTFLANELCKHGYKISTFGKEVTFFDYRIKNKVNYDFKSPEYIKYINSFEGSRKTLDASPWNISESSARHIRHYFPDAKIIICIRNPIERAVSHFMHNIHLHDGIDKNSYEFEKKIPDIVPVHFQQSVKSYDYIRHSDYDRTIKNFQKHSSNKNIFLFNVDFLDSVNNKLSCFLEDHINIANLNNRVNANASELGTNLARRIHKLLKLNLRLETKDKIKKMSNKAFIFKNFRQMKYDKLENNYRSFISDSKEFALLQDKYENILKNF